MPPTLYVIALLAAMAVAASGAFLREYRNHAADSATYKANIQTTEDNLKAAHDANDQLERERASAERAMALARSAAAQAQARYDASAHEVEELAARSVDVRTYLDSAMPCDLYRELRHDFPDSNQGDCEEGAATPGELHPGADASLAGPAQPRPAGRAETAPSRPRNMQRERSRAR